METDFNSLLEYIKGNWSLQTDLYIKKKKKENQAQQKINLFHKLSKLNIDLQNHNFLDQQYYLYTDKLLSVIIYKNKITVSEVDNDTRFCLSLKNLSANSFQIHCESEDYEIYYDEKLYIINENIMISIALLKDPRSSRNIGSKVTSYVRSLQN